MWGYDENMFKIIHALLKKQRVDVTINDSHTAITSIVEVELEYLPDVFNNSPYINHHSEGRVFLCLHEKAYTLKSGSYSSDICILTFTISYNYVTDVLGSMLDDDIFSDAYKIHIKIG